MNMAQDEATAQSSDVATATSNLKEHGPPPGVPTLTGHDDHEYSMGHSQRGVALIYHDSKETEDAKKLSKCLQSFGFDVKTTALVSGQQPAIFAPLTGKDLSNHDCLFIGVISEVSQNIQDQIEKFLNAGCPHLANKPKIFLIQENKSIKLDAKNVTVAKSYFVNNKSDCLYIYGNIQDYAWHLSEALEILGHRVDMVALLSLLNRAVKRKYKQCVPSFYCSTLCRNLVLRVKEPAALIYKTKEMFTFNKDLLEKVLHKRNVGDRKIVILSAVGVCREGKSFLLNYMLRFLRAEDKKCWEGADATPLKGFEWKNGSRGITSGIFMWPEVFFVGKDLAVVLVDTQGTCHVTSDKDDPFIFSISTLMSSVQIFNVSKKIRTDEFKNAKSLLEFARMNRKAGNSDTFQKLVYLIRDWELSDEYGFEGGKEHLEESSQCFADSTASKDTPAQNISSYFSDVSCFLMPHPGKCVSRSTFTGAWKDLDEAFLRELKFFVEKILSPEFLVEKKWNGKTIDTNTLVSLISNYVTKIQATNVINPIAEGYIKTFLDQSRTYYTSEMKFASVNCSSMPGFQSFHEQTKSEALKKYDVVEHIWSKEPLIVQQFRNKLINFIEIEYKNQTDQFIKNQHQKNVSERERALKLAQDEAVNDYMQAIREVSTGVVKEYPKGLPELIQRLKTIQEEIFNSKFAEIKTKYDERDIRHHKQQYYEITNKVLSTVDEVYESMSKKNLKGMPIEIAEILGTACKANPILDFSTRTACGVVEVFEQIKAVKNLEDFEDIVLIPTLGAFSDLILAVMKDKKK